MRSAAIGEPGYSGALVRKGPLCALSALLAALVLASTASAGGPYMLVGAADDLPKAQDAAFAKSELDLAKLAGLDAIRVTQTWTKGQTTLGPGNAITLGNAVTAAQFAGVRLILSLYPFGSSVTPLTDQ